MKKVVAGGTKSDTTSAQTTSTATMTVKPTVVVGPGATRLRRVIFIRHGQRVDRYLSHAYRVSFIFHFISLLAKRGRIKRGPYRRYIAKSWPWL